MSEPKDSTPTIIVEYDPAWEVEYQAIAAVLAAAFKTLASNIYHVGSTAIPGMTAKPILDIDIELAPGVSISVATEILASLGYDYQGNLGIVDRHAYRNISPAVPYSSQRHVWMNHHLYVCPNHSTELTRHLMFRDKLRKNESLRNEYNELKQEALRRSHGERQVYIDEKARLSEEFFKRVLNT